MLQVDGVVFAKWQNLQFNLLAHEVGQAYEHGFAIPEVVLHQDAVGIDAGNITLVVYLEIEVKVLVQFVEVADGPCGRLFPITFDGLCSHLLTALSMGCAATF